MLSLADLDLFTVHLAVHLLGADTIRTRASEQTPFQLYWRSPLLHKGGSPSLSAVPSCNEASQSGILFVDLTFDFAWKFDDDNDNMDALIRVNLGSLWEEKDSVVYYSGRVIGGIDLEHHFLEASIDETSTPPPILAKCFADALQELSVTTMNETSQDPSKRIKLYYRDVECFAELNTSDGASANVVPDAIVQMMMLHQRHQETDMRSTHDGNNATSRPVVETAEIDSICSLVVDQWKPHIQKDISARREEAAKIRQAKAAECAPPPETTPVPACAPPCASESTPEETLAAPTTVTVNDSTESTSEPPKETAPAKPTPVVKKPVIRKKGAAHGFAKINPKKPKKGGLQFAD